MSFLLLLMIMYVKTLSHESVLWLLHHKLVPIGVSSREMTSGEGKTLLSGVEGAGWPLHGAEASMGGERGATLGGCGTAAVAPAQDSACLGGDPSPALTTSAPSGMSAIVLCL